MFKVTLLNKIVFLMIISFATNKPFQRMQQVEVNAWLQVAEVQTWKEHGEGLRNEISKNCAICVFQSP